MLNAILSAIDAVTGSNNNAPKQRTKPATRRHPQHGQLHTITVQKPFCAPCRDRLLTFLFLPDKHGRPIDGDWKYGVPMYNLRERVNTVSVKDAAKLWKIELKDRENLKYGPAAVAFMPLSWQASFDVLIQHAKWAQYCTERIGFAVVAGGLDANARRNADKYNFKPPPRWDGREIQIEPTCSDGVELWNALYSGNKPPNVDDELMAQLTTNPAD